MLVFQHYWHKYVLPQGQLPTSPWFTDVNQHSLPAHSSRYIEELIKSSAALLRARLGPMSRIAVKYLQILWTGVKAHHGVLRWIPAIHLSPYLSQLLSAGLSIRRCLRVPLFNIVPPCNDACPFSDCGLLPYSGLLPQADGCPTLLQQPKSCICERSREMYRLVPMHVYQFFPGRLWQVEQSRRYHAQTWGLDTERLRINLSYRKSLAAAAPNFTTKLAPRTCSFGDFVIQG